MEWSDIKKAVSEFEDIADEDFAKLNFDEKWDAIIEFLLRTQRSFIDLVQKVSNWNNDIRSFVEEVKVLEKKLLSWARCYSVIRL